MSKQKDFTERFSQKKKVLGSARDQDQAKKTAKENKKEDLKDGGSLTETVLLGKDKCKE